MTSALLWLFARLVPQRVRRRWLEEWRAELRHGPGSMILGALPDAWTMRRLRNLPPEGGRNSSKGSPWPPASALRSGVWKTDARQTIRSLIRAPWHVITVSLCLGVGIAVCVTVFSILSSILTGNLPGMNDRPTLMRLYITTDEGRRGRSLGGASLRDYEALKLGAPSMPLIAAEGRWDFAVRTAAGSAAVEGAFVSGNYFQALGTQPALGRLLTPADDRADAAPAVVLSHAFWTATLGAPADVVGSTILVGGHDVLVAGVAPEHFSGTDVGDLGEPPGLRYKLYLPLSLAGTLAPALSREEQWLTVVGRAAPGASHEVLAAELQPLAARIEAASPATRKNAGVSVFPHGMGVGETLAVVAAVVTLMMAAPLTVLGIGCANVANLQLVRASLRRRELAVRLSIGASRAQLVRLIAFESVALAVTACVAGGLGTSLLLRIAALVIPFHITIDLTVLVFAAATACLVVFATGIIPAWLVTRAREGLSLTANSQSATGATSRVRRGLVIAQIALSLLLLLTAALFTRALGALIGRVPATAREVIVAEIRFDTLAYSQPQRAAFVEALRGRLAADGRVAAIGVNTVTPFNRGGRRFWLPGDDDRRLRSADGGEVTAGWFEAAGVTLLRGRIFTPEDVRLGNAAIVDRAFVERYRLSEPVLGTVLRVGDSGLDPSGADNLIVEPGDTVAFSTAPWRKSLSPPGDMTIVGVVSNTLPRPVSPRARPSLYLPLRAIPDYVTVYVRSEWPVEIGQQVRAVMAALDPNLPAVEISTLASRFDTDAGDLRLLAQAASGLGTAALLLAVAGVYSVIAFFVSLRTREFGLRMALGARPGDITNMVVIQASRLVLTGLGVGVLLGIPLLIFLAKAFPYTSAFDAIGLLGPSVALAVTALIAATIPARKAARVDPCAALRTE